MQRILILLLAGSVFTLFYSILRYFLGKERAIERLNENYYDELNDDNNAKVNKEDKKLAVKFFAESLKKSGLFKDYIQEKRMFLRKAYLHITIEEFIAMKLVLILLLNLFLMIVSSSILASVVFGIIFIVLGWKLPDVFIGMLIEKRKKILNRQLCDSLKIISNSLRAGQAFFQAVATMVQEVDGPISQEFGIMLNEVKLGVSIEEALENMTERLDSEDLKFVSTAVIIQRETGGNLADVIDSISETIKGRISLYRELLAASAQGVISAVIISIIPVLLTFYVLLINRNTHGVLISDPIGIAMLVVASLMWLLGIYFIRRILKIKF